MRSAWSALAVGVGLVHLAAIVFVVVGGPLSIRWPRLLPVHLVVLVGMVAINVSGSDCFLTVWEKAAIERAGRTPYEGGFISHYLVEPWHPQGITGRVNLIMLLVVCVPTVWSYAVVGRRWARRRGAGPPKGAPAS